MGFNSAGQNSMYMGMINSFPIVNSIQNNFGQLLYFPPVNNLLFYNWSLNFIFFSSLFSIKPWINSSLLL